MGTTQLGASLAGLLLFVAAASAGCAPEAPSKAAQDLCSKDGLMRLVPQLRNADGRFQIPDPIKDLDTFLAAQQGLSNAIETILAKARAAHDPYSVAVGRNTPLSFGSRWRAAEVGIKTDGRSISFVDSNFASYGGQSFLEGLKPVDQSNGVFHAVAVDGSVSALVYAMPTVLPCVNRLILAAENSAGSWPQPTYALGPEAGGEAFLIVNICQDLGRAVSTGSDQQAVLRPNAELILAFQWADTEDMAAFRTDQKAHQHR